MLCAIKLSFLLLAALPVVASCSLSQVEEAREDAAAVAEQITELYPPPASPYAILRLDEERPWTGLTRQEAAAELLPAHLRTADAVTLPLTGSLDDPALAARIEAGTGLPVRFQGPASSSSAGAFLPPDHLLPEGGIWTGALPALLDRWCEARGYAWRYEADEAALAVIRRETVVFRLNALAGSQNLSGTTTTSDSAGEGGSRNLARQSLSLRTEYDPWPEITSQLTAQLGEGVAISAAPATATVSVTGPPAEIDRARRYFAWLNDHVLRPVTLTVDVYAVEFVDGRNFELGVVGTLERLFGTTAGLAVGSEGTIGIVRPAPNADSLAAVVSALHETGTVSRVLSASVPSLNAQPAQFFELFSEAYLSEVRTTASEGVAQTSLKSDTVSSGFAMSFVAQIVAADEVLVRLFASLQDRPVFTVFASANQQIQLPAYGSRAIQVTQKLRRGETLVVSGFRDRGAVGNRRGTFADALPFPFGGQEGSESRTEQVLLLTADVGAPLGIAETQAQSL